MAQTRRAAPPGGRAVSGQPGKNPRDLRRTEAARKAEAAFRDVRTGEAGRRAQEAVRDFRDSDTARKAQEAVRDLRDSDTRPQSARGRARPAQQ